MTTESKSNGGISKMALTIILTLFGLVIGLGSWNFNYTLGNIEKQIVVLQADIKDVGKKVDDLPVKISDLQGLDNLLLLRIDRNEEDIKELKK